MWQTAGWLMAFFVVALLARSIFSITPGIVDGTYSFTGNDPYYELRHLNHVVSTGKNLDFDDALNFPQGRGNPNPPLWIWATAPIASFVAHHTSVQDPTAAVLNWSGATFGALIVFPVYMIGRDMFGRRAGLWASFLMSLSAPHIQRTAFGFAKHDAATIFFITCAMAFLMRGLRLAQDREYVRDWRNGSSIGAGLRDAVKLNQASFLWAGLAGVCLSAAALMWKGYDYALGILGLAIAIQLVVDHVRKRDSTATLLLYLVPLVLVTLIPYLLYYHLYAAYMSTTIIPGLYVLFGVLVLGLFLVPTRNLPSVLVFPGVILAVIVGLIALRVVVPGTYRIIVTGLGYFVQSKLYSTIAEAQRPALGDVAANFAFGAFLLAFWGLARVIRRAWKGQAASVLLLAFAGISLFLSFSASRFLMNSAPAFAVLAGAVTVTMLEWAGALPTQRRFGQQQSRWSGKAVSVAIVVALLVVFPVVVEGVDASVPFDTESSRHLTTPSNQNPEGKALKLGDHFFGAFGIGFELKFNGWQQAMEALAKRDTCWHDAVKVCSPSDPDYRPLEARPGFIAWWDYGHWSIGIGQHPTVADPFQDHYELAGRFLASESESEGIQWLNILYLDTARLVNHGTLNASTAAAVDAFAPGLSTQLNAIQVGSDRAYDREYAALSVVKGNDTFRLYDQLSALDGRRVDYIGVDDRMYVTPQSPGIFYAPVFLANKNPDDFFEVRFAASSSPSATVLVRKEYGVDANNNSYRRTTPIYVDSQSGAQWVYNPSDGKAYPPGTNPHLGGVDPNSGIAVFQSSGIQTTERYGRTMFARAFPGFDLSQAPGSGMAHWRAIWQTVTTGVNTQTGEPTPVRSVVLLQYFHGVDVSGKLQDDAGTPLGGLTVSFADGMGATHGQAVSASDGTFHVTAPFAQANDLSLVVSGTSGIVYKDNSSAYQFSLADAQAGHAVQLPPVVLKRGTVTGHVFVDKNGNGAYDAANDTLLSGATVRLDGNHVVPATNGTFVAKDLEPGAHNATATVKGYATSTKPFAVKSGQTDAVIDFAMAQAPSLVNVSFAAKDGHLVPGVHISVSGPRGNGTLLTTGSGSVTQSLPEGHYTLHVNDTTTQNNVTTTYTGSAVLDVPFGGEPMSVTVHDGVDAAKKPA